MSGSLVHSPADILRHLMINLSLGTLPSDNGSFPISVDQSPNKPDSAITTLDRAGRIGGKDHPTGQLQRHPGVQIIIRAAISTVASKKADDILKSLTESVKRSTVSISTSTYTVQSVTVTSGPISLGKEVPVSNRNIYSINVVVSLRQVS